MTSPELLVAAAGAVPFGAVVAFLLKWRGRVRLSFEYDGRNNPSD